MFVCLVNIQFSQKNPLRTENVSNKLVRMLHINICTSNNDCYCYLTGEKVRFIYSWIILIIFLFLCMFIFTLFNVCDAGETKSEY